MEGVFTWNPPPPIIEGGIEEGVGMGVGTMAFRASGAVVAAACCLA